MLTEYNYALLQPTDQSTILTFNGVQYLSSYAVDGDYRTRSGTTGSDSKWWKVMLAHQILLSDVAVYVRTGSCGGNPCREYLH